ncbi:hypothetical protein AQUSIP_00760 [Aquicella siphonis]|uniref:Ras-GEF domain-containing protein n=1 Tax=Aquicella siphonis TaxID=254247 RepID=A0A5E4PDG6_9COXI|nr:RasGEF domain-containing protein [Aquicella siphonis]VVC74804.1 hypothetical protein AQUSIP_00760 [Aquicella siphonis]
MTSTQSQTTSGIQDIIQQLESFLASPPDQRQGDMNALISQFDQALSRPETKQLLGSNPQLREKVAEMQGRIIDVYATTLTHAAETAFNTLKIEDVKKPGDIEDLAKHIAVASSNLSEGIKWKILSIEDPEIRRQTIERYIFIAEEMTKSGNFFGAQAIYSGLHMDGVYQLFRTDEGLYGLSPEASKAMEKLRGLYKGDISTDEILEAETTKFQGHKIPNINILMRRIGVCMAGHSDAMLFAYLNTEEKIKLIKQIREPADSDVLEEAKKNLNDRDFASLKKDLAALQQKRASKSTKEGPDAEMQAIIESLKDLLSERGLTLEDVDKALATKKGKPLLILESSHSDYKKDEQEQIESILKGLLNDHPVVDLDATERKLSDHALSLKQQRNAQEQKNLKLVKEVYDQAYQPFGNAIDQAKVIPAVNPANFPELVENMKILNVKAELLALTKELESAITKSIDKENKDLYLEAIQNYLNGVGHIINQYPQGYPKELDTVKKAFEEIVIEIKNPEFKVTKSERIKLNSKASDPASQATQSLSRKLSDAAAKMLKASKSYTEAPREEAKQQLIAAAPAYAQLLEYQAELAERVKEIKDRNPGVKDDDLRGNDKIINRRYEALKEVTAKMLNMHLCGKTEDMMIYLHEQMTSSWLTTHHQAKINVREMKNQDTTVVALIKEVYGQLLTPDAELKVSPMEQARRDLTDKWIGLLEYRNSLQHDTSTIGIERQKFIFGVIGTLTLLSTTEEKYQYINRLLENKADNPILQKRHKDATSLVSSVKHEEIKLVRVLEAYRDSITQLNSLEMEQAKKMEQVQQSSAARVQSPSGATPTSTKKPQQQRKAPPPTPFEALAKYNQQPPESIIKALKNVENTLSAANIQFTADTGPRQLTRQDIQFLYNEFLDPVKKSSLDATQVKNGEAMLQAIAVNAAALEKQHRAGVSAKGKAQPEAVSGADSVSPVSTQPKSQYARWQDMQVQVNLALQKCEGLLQNDATNPELIQIHEHLLKRRGQLSTFPLTKENQNAIDSGKFDKIVELINADFKQNVEQRLDVISRQIEAKQASLAKPEPQPQIDPSWDNKGGTVIPPAIWEMMKSGDAKDLNEIDTYFMNNESMCKLIDSYDADGKTLFHHLAERAAAASKAGNRELADELNLLANNLIRRGADPLLSSNNAQKQTPFDIAKDCKEFKETLDEAIREKMNTSKDPEARKVYNDWRAELYGMNVKDRQFDTHQPSPITHPKPVTPVKPTSEAASKLDAGHQQDKRKVPHKGKVIRNPIKLVTSLFRSKKQDKLATDHSKDSESSYKNRH